nr:B3 domain-containing protein Os03g0164300-like [Lolium perenne]
MASFDEYCIFANNMKLTRKQVGTLENLDPPGEHMKYYVYKMKRSSLTPKKCKMEFGVEFTNAYLKRYLRQPIEVHVECNICTEKGKIRMEMGRGSEINKATLTSGWAKAVRRYLIEEEDIYIFMFSPNSDDGLHLLIMHL